VKAGGFCEERQEPLYPAVNRAPIDHDATLGEPFDNVSVTQPEA
jgi:hypothetical protein